MQTPSYAEIVRRIDAGGRLLVAEYPSGKVPWEAFIRAAEICDLPLSAELPEEVERHVVSRTMYLAGFCRDAVVPLELGYQAVWSLFSLPQADTMH